MRTILTQREDNAREQWSQHPIHLDDEPRTQCTGHEIEERNAGLRTAIQWWKQWNWNPTWCWRGPNGTMFVQEIKSCVNPIVWREVSHISGKFVKPSTCKACCKTWGLETYLPSIRRRRQIANVNRLYLYPSRLLQTRSPLARATRQVHTHLKLGQSSQHEHTCLMIHDAKDARC